MIRIALLTLLLLPPLAVAQGAEARGGADAAEHPLHRLRGQRPGAGLLRRSVCADAEPRPPCRRGRAVYPGLCHAGRLQPIAREFSDRAVSAPARADRSCDLGLPHVPRRHAEPPAQPQGRRLPHRHHRQAAHQSRVGVSLRLPRNPRRQLRPQESRATTRNTPRPSFKAGDQPFFLSVNYPEAHDPWLRQVDGLPEQPQTGDA